MNTFASIGELKYRAKNHLTGRFGIVINAIVTVQLIVSGISILVNIACDQSTNVGQIIYFAIQLLITALIGVFTSGQCYLYLNLCCARPVDPSMIYYGFKNQADKAVFLQLMQFLLFLAPTVPGFSVIVIGLVTNQMIVIQIGEILVFASTIGTMYLALCVSQTFYLLHDFPNYSVKELLLFSNKIMKGYKWKLFLLLLSFVPLLLAAILSLGIGLLWVEPYMNTATTEFFLELMRRRETELESLNLK